MSANLARSTYLMPVDVEKDEEGKENVRLLYVQNKKGERYQPIFSDTGELVKHYRGKEVQNRLIQVRFDQLSRYMIKDVQGYVLNPEEIALSQSTTGLVTADAMAKAFGTSVMAKVIIVGGMCGIVTSWNSFMIGGSRALYSMAESYMVPKVFAKLHPKHKTPVNALILIGILTMIAPFAGRVMMVWICDAGNFGCCLAYCMVSLSFLILRKKEPDMPRPYRVPAYKFVGTMAVILSGCMVLVYCIPGSGGTLIMQEWMMVGAWSLLGVVFYAVCKVKYKEKFGSLIEIISDEDAASLMPEADDKELDLVIDAAIDRVLSRMTA